MIIVSILGGLGNQMFQYAFAYTLSQSKNVKLDRESFKTYDLRKYELDLFKVSLDIANSQEVEKIKYAKENVFTKIYRKLRRKEKELSSQYFKEPHFYYNEEIFNLNKSYFEGYWQSEKYFLNYRDSLLKEFTLKDELHQESKVYQKDINNFESVSLHIRRGDYISNPHTNSVHGTCSLAYYQKAVDKIQEMVKKSHFFIFSDDLNWTKENLSFIEKYTAVELSEETPDYEEMYLMSQCKHNIIANSSFSWWGAWLNQHSDKIVIAPKKWFVDSSVNTNDLIPNGWICL